MLVVEVINDQELRVIHYTVPDDGATSTSDVSSAASFSAASFSGRSTEIAIIKEEVISVNPDDDIVELVEYDDPKVVLYEGQEAIERARSRIKEKKYNLLFKNCESLINWAITNREETGQGLAAMILGGAAALGIAAAAAAAASVVMTLGLPLSITLAGAAVAINQFEQNNKHKQSDEKNKKK
uniref:LRAT domain-containing protein n=1 Tax=Amphimedon queenslandica TaxID=400682 RepID=A0A1X7SW08_AMPQE